MLGEVISLGERLGGIGSALEKGVEKMGRGGIADPVIDLGWVDEAEDLR